MPGGYSGVQRTVGIMKMIEIPKAELVENNAILLLTPAAKI